MDYLLYIVTTSLPHEVLKLQSQHHISTGLFSIRFWLCTADIDCSLTCETVGDLFGGPLSRMPSNNADNNINNNKSHALKVRFGVRRRHRGLG